MKNYIKIFMTLILLVVVCACGKRSETVFIEKDGTEYKVGNQVSFYYPKQFEMDITSKNTKTISFAKDNEIFSYMTIKDDTDNKVEDMMTLYAGQLEEDGATEVAYKNITITSGLECQEFTGSYLSTGIYFKHMVYFTTDASYIYSYQAPKDVYDKNITVISKYLESLTVHHEQVS